MRKSQSTTESFDNSLLLDADEDESDDDERPDSVDDKVRQKEMRKGIDLATTLERIEKNFVITDPRLPDNPIVRLRIPAKYIVSNIYLISGHASRGQFLRN